MQWEEYTPEAEVTNNTSTGAAAAVESAAHTEIVELDSGELAGDSGADLIAQLGAPATRRALENQLLEVLAVLHIPSVTNLPVRTDSLFSRAANR